MLMVKPALAYMDVIWRVRKQLTPVAYNVSEYSMIKAAASTVGLTKSSGDETLTGFKRAALT